MPTISYDGQSFIIDGRRAWLVSGAIHYTRVPSQLWRERVRAARQAGLNCIETYAFWNVHEPSPGVFNFEGDADLRRFVQTVAEEGMYCILRPGPYICAEWDFGGLPPWLLQVKGVRLRQANAPFLEACARYLGALFEQVRDLQANVPGSGAAAAAASAPGGGGVSGGGASGGGASGGGPIVMVQAENEWICHNPQQGESYLRELVRYLRESGCTVPINVCNNLWQRVDGAIDTWNANEHLAGDLRQLRVVQPDAPRIVTEFWPGWFDQWGGQHHDEYDAEWTLYRLAQVLASGAQYNLYMFQGGTNFGFYGGRSISGRDAFITTSYDYDAPLHEAGGRGQKYLAVKRISTFASQFGQLFAHLDPDAGNPAIALTDGDHGLSVIDQRGSQGQVIFIFKGAREKATQTAIMLPNGLTLPVPLGRHRVAWFALNVNLAGVAELSYTNLRPWAFVDRRMLVLFGPAGAEGLIAINDAAWAVTVPEGREPLVERHEDLTVVVLSEEQVDAAYLSPQGLVVGAAGLGTDDQPLPLRGWPETVLVRPGGEVERQRARPARSPVAPRLAKWEQARLDGILAGDSARFQPIPGPASLEELDAPFGYGWYRLALRGSFNGRVLAPQAGDRLHLFADGEPLALLGLAPGAEYSPVSLRLGGTLTVLADNLGRFNFGWNLGERKGLFGHLYTVKPFKLGKPKVVAGIAPDPFVLSDFVLYQRKGDQPPADALVWRFKAPSRRPMVLDIQGLPAKAMVFVNDQPVGLYDQRYSAGLGRFLVQQGEPLKAGNNELRLALFGKHDGGFDPLRFVTLYETTANISQDAEWSFARWAPPEDGEFGSVKRTNRPCWYRCRFNAGSSTEPLWLEPKGMSKGQLYLNGRNVGRYFVATAAGKAVSPQQRYYLPEPWLNQSANELLIFDEHGKSPAGCRLTFDPMGPYREQGTMRQP